MIIIYYVLRSRWNKAEVELVKWKISQKKISRVKHYIMTKEWRNTKKYVAYTGNVARKSYMNIIRELEVKERKKE
jgi:hypothetical protein